MPTTTGMFTEKGILIKQYEGLQWIRRRVKRDSLSSVSLFRYGDTEGALRLTFLDGTFFQCSFDSYASLQKYVRNWNNLHGAPLSIDGHKQGRVSQDNSFLF